MDDAQFMKITRRYVLVVQNQTFAYWKLFQFLLIFNKRIIESAEFDFSRMMHRPIYIPDFLQDFLKSVDREPGNFCNNSNNFNKLVMRYKRSTLQLKHLTNVTDINYMTTCENNV